MSEKSDLEYLAAVIESNMFLDFHEVIRRAIEYFNEENTPLSQQ